MTEPPPQTAPPLQHDQTASPPMHDQTPLPTQPPTPITSTGPLSSQTSLPTATSPTLPQTLSPPTHTIPTPTHPHPPLPARSITTRLSHGIIKPNPKYAHLSTISSTGLPTSTKQALSIPHWRSAMFDEYQALTRNQTWSLVPSTTAHNVVGCKWVFRIKYNPDNTIQKYKARLVAKGFHQKPGIDYSETFSPVVKPTTVRVLLSLATSQNWSLRQLDINNAFLQGTLHESVFMSQPPGFVDSTNPSHVCHLAKAIYGLKQAPRAWFTELKNYLTSYGFKPSLADPSLFIFSGSTPVYLLVYVDDIIITGPSPTLLSTFISNLSNRFSLKDLGPLSYFLGVEVTPNHQGLLLTQTKYIHDILTRHHMIESKPLPTPMVAYPPLTHSTHTPAHDPTNYRAIIGSLQYLSFTRPDIAFTVNKLAQFMQNPPNLPLDHP